jgi:hypothetical protein
MRKLFPYALSLAVLFLAATVVMAAGPKVVSETAMAGPYAITLKVLPAESFTGPESEMTWDAGAKAVLLASPVPPNHHLVAFVKRDGKPVEDASVVIRYREMRPAESAWATLPVARMHVTGKSLATTHYGNNVELTPGSYEAEVAVNGAKPAVFHFTI